ncbi:hypothetical protein LTR01_004175 [Friedmanniomyces endolithicus]|nr:hypothetical protein LTR01_004175 [Friedmanniomyces endolithicus]KAK0826472.1 hypothetical protein LTR73_006337 [Friedmanniomyces endolithicus]
MLPEGGDPMPGEHGDEGDAGNSNSTTSGNQSGVPNEQDHHQHIDSFTLAVASSEDDSSAVRLQGTEHHDDGPQGQISDTAEDAYQWDFVLPVVPPSTANLITSSTYEYEVFNIRELVAWMQYGTNAKTVMQYLNRFDDETVRKAINDSIEGFPAMFYVVETNDEDMIRLWVSHGGDVSVIHDMSKVPLLAFAVILDENIQTDTTLMTATLLSLGAVPNLIPSAFYSPYLQNLPEHGPSDDDLEDLTDEQKGWCKDMARGKLARTCSLTHRYHLERASKTKKLSHRHYQVAKRTKAEPLLGIANFLIGQTSTAKYLMDTLLTHILEPGKKPLVLVFAGPSGHGKTELARHLGHLLSLELEVVDCTIFNREMELFGSRHPYAGAGRGTPLNNFLATYSGRRCIVFLDEFEKTSPEIHKALLLPFDNGEYQDRRTLNKIDCSKTIWIMATNAHDVIIQVFSTMHSRILFSEEHESEKRLLLKQLSYKIRDDFRSKHGAPVAGRISEFLPFLTFTIGEQAVIVHKALLELGRKVRQPVSLVDGPDEKLLGNVKLRIRRDVSVCRALAESEYHPDLGARSLLVAAEKVKRMLVDEYLNIDEEITEEGGVCECLLDEDGGEVTVNMVTPELQ